MVSCNEWFVYRSSNSMEPLDSGRKRLIQRIVFKLKLSLYGNSLTYLLLSILLFFQIVILPLGAATSSKGKSDYSLLNDGRQQQLWMHGMDAAFKRQQNKSSSDRTSRDNNNNGISNATLPGEVMFTKWGSAERVLDDHLQHYHSRQFVLFTFIAVHGGTTELFVIDSAQIHVIELQPKEELILTCQANLLGLGDDMDIVWWKNDQFITTTNSSIVISDDKSLGLYRCVADVDIVSTDLLDSYLLNNRIKRSAEMPPGKVMSNAFIIRRAVPFYFAVHPENLTVEVGSVFRLKCATRGAHAHPIVWIRNNTELVAEENNIQIYAVEHQSVLHLLGALFSDSGRYRCRSGDLYSDEAVIDVVTSVQNSTKYPLLMEELPSELSVPVGKSIILECLVNDVRLSSFWHVVNDYGQPIKKYHMNDGKKLSAVVIRSANTQDSGKYSCIVFNKTIQETFSTFITVQVAPILLVKRPVKRIAGTLGTTIRLRCSSSVEPHDTSFEINWYKDGKRVIPFGRAKVDSFSFRT
ncbi:unnamed protein product [Thelazia callipaeda]|uniref:Ig-like domain-containing protein n=1 Tax=Thelazia callipaeda TaxID=103827 RepID=A0A0N5CMK2_THECL|nr:unnamed protein product [Thelazia callipaeda]